MFDIIMGRGHNIIYVKILEAFRIGSWQSHGEVKMDFEKVFQIVVNDFNKEDVAYALIGGFAVGVWGIMRTTTDLDFIILLKNHCNFQIALKFVIGIF